MMDYKSNFMRLKKLIETTEIERLISLHPLYDDYLAINKGKLDVMTRKEYTEYIIGICKREQQKRPLRVYPQNETSK